MVELHRARVRSLASVDEQVGALIDTLRKERELSNTYIVFTSDNGVLLGEHRLTMKNWPYEPDLAIPLIVRGPGLPHGRMRDVTFGLVDLAPTFLDMADATAGRPLDGRSMLASLRDGDPGYSRYLIQAGSKTAEWGWRGVRSSDHSYVRHSDGTEELYDRVNDPSQLQNLAGEPGSARLLKQYGAWLEALQDCAGAACHGP
jgi:arylsulfatase A-like enzyme